MDRDEIAQIIATEIRRVHGGYPDNRNYLEAADAIRALAGKDAEE